jgi:hypothetical protein
MSDESSSSTRRAGYLTDHQGKPSAMRALSFLALGASIVFGLLLIWDIVAGINGHTSDRLRPGVYIVVVFLLAGTAPKAVQKFAEARFPAP